VPASGGDPTVLTKRPFPNVANGRYQISIGGGRSPTWGSDGHELFFVNRSSVMSVPVQIAPAFSAGTPTKLFEARSAILDGRFRGVGSIRTYDISRDGRFLMIKENVVADEHAGPPSLIVVQNWSEDLERRVPTR
jgi:hypothetical protein